MKSKIQGALLGVMLGDALGMPVETMSRSGIVKALGPNGVTGFINPVQARVEDTKNMRAGDTTDDWQLTRVVLNSLIACKGWNREHMIALHCTALRETTFGWGKGSVVAIQAIIDGKRDGHTPPQKIAGVGLGNGVIMKVAPLALYHALINLKAGLTLRKFAWRKFAENVRQLGAITHSDPRAWITAFAVGMYIVGALYGRLSTANDFGRHAHFVSTCVEELEDLNIPSEEKRELVDLLFKVFGHTKSSEELAGNVGCKFVCTETMPFVIGTFMRNPNDFRAGVLEAVNAGGDTDTNASIVGALIGAAVGLEGIPTEWRTFRPEFKEAITLGGSLHNLIV